MKPQEINHYFSSCQPSEAEKQELAKLFNAAGWNLNDPSYGGLWNLLGGLMRAEWKLQWMNDGRPAQGHATNVRMKHRKWPGRMQGALWVGQGTMELDQRWAPRRLGQPTKSLQALTYCSGAHWRVGA